MSSSSSSSSLCLSSLILSLILIISGVSSSSNNTNLPTKIGQGYRLIAIEETPDGGLLGHLQVKQKNNVYGSDITHLQLFVK